MASTVGVGVDVESDLGGSAMYAVNSNSVVSEARTTACVTTPRMLCRRMAVSLSAWPAVEKANSRNLIVGKGGAARSGNCDTPFGRPDDGRSARAVWGGNVTPLFFASSELTSCRYTCTASGDRLFAHADCSYCGYLSSDATISSVTTPLGKAGRKVPGALEALAVTGGAAMVPYAADASVAGGCGDWE